MVRFRLALRMTPQQVSQGFAVMRNQASNALVPVAYHAKRRTTGARGPFLDTD